MFSKRFLNFFIKLIFTFYYKFKKINYKTPYFKDYFPRHNIIFDIFWIQNNSYTINIFNIVSSKNTIM